MQEKKDIPKVEREGWKAEKLVEEATNEESDDIVRKMLRGDETRGNPDERDIAGVPDYEKIRQKKNS
jgi:hypothetical protein